MSLSLPPLIPKLDAVLVLDGDGSRLAGKYYGDFLTNTSSSKAAMKTLGSGDEKSSSAATVEDLRATFERQLQAKIGGIAARPDAAEVVTVMGKTAVFCGGTSNGSGASDVRIVHVAPQNESELVLAHLCEGVYNALSRLMSGQTDRSMILDNLEMVFLLIDEHCDGGYILETDPVKLASSVLLRDASDGMDGENPAGKPGMGGPTGDMSIGEAIKKAREQLISNFQNNGL